MMFTPSKSPKSRNGGYMMLEAVAALVILGIGAMALHGTIRQALITRGQAQDYTEARFLLEQMIADVDVQPDLIEGTWPVSFTEHPRFRGEYSIRRVNPPIPPIPEGVSPNYVRQPWLAHVTATLHWKRAGREFEETFETLVAGSRLWQPRDRR